MKQLTIKGRLRTTGKKANVNSVRKEERVPCIVYGHGIENISFSVDAKDLKLMTDTPNSYIINLDIEGNNIKAILHQAQYHPVSDKAIHADFLAINEDKPVSIDIPVNISGNSEGVKQGGKLIVNARKLRVSGNINNLPDVLPIDITKLKLGKQITAGDLSFEGIQIISSKSTIVCAVRMTRAAIADDSTGANAAASSEAASGTADNDKK